MATQSDRSPRATPAAIRLLAGILLASAATAGSSPAAERPSLAAAMKADRKQFTDAQIIDGFFKLAFGAEMQLEGRVDRIRKFDKPVRIFVSNRARPDRRTQLATVIEDIRSRVANLDIAIIRERGDANVELVLVRDRDIVRTVHEIFGAATAQRIQKQLAPQCLSGFRKDDDYRIIRADIILAADTDTFVFRDCAYEEILQALGPINDDPSIPWTMFNDNVQKGFFGVYDQYILNILYDPRIKAGMTRNETRAIIGDVLKTVRPFVERRNGLRTP